MSLEMQECELPCGKPLPLNSRRHNYSSCKVILRSGKRKPYMCSSSLMVVCMSVDLCNLYGTGWLSCNLYFFCITVLKQAPNSQTIVLNHSQPKLHPADLPTPGQIWWIHAVVTNNFVELTNFLHTMSEQMCTQTLNVHICQCQVVCINPLILER